MPGCYSTDYITSRVPAQDNGTPGAGGAAVVGNANVTWTSTGTIYGSKN